MLATISIATATTLAAATPAFADSGNGNGNGNGNGDSSGLSAPTSVDATAGDGQVTVSWNDPRGPTGCGDRRPVLPRRGG